MTPMDALRTKLRSCALIRAAVTTIDPARRRVAKQWRRIDAAVSSETVLSGPFAGMTLTSNTTGSHIPKRLGSYELELQPLIESWSGYDTVLDVGCGEGWYVVGLARRMPTATVWGFDTSTEAQRACGAMAAANGVTVNVAGEASPVMLASLAKGKTLIIVDAEGAEIDVLDPTSAPGLRSADLLVETHDFLRPGAAATIRSRFAERAVVELRQVPRDPIGYPLLTGLAEPDQRLALDEARPVDQVWLWLPA